MTDAGAGILLLLGTMSAHTGDKARFNKDRKRKIARKAAMRILRAELLKPVVAAVPAVSST